MLKKQDANNPNLVTNLQIFNLFCWKLWTHFVIHMYNKECPQFLVPLRGDYLVNVHTCFRFQLSFLCLAIQLVIHI